MTSDLTAPMVRQMCGDIADWKLEAILETGASAAELERALAVAEGVGDAVADRGSDLTGVTGHLYDLLIAEREFEEER